MAGKSYLFTRDNTTSGDAQPVRVHQCLRFVRLGLWILSLADVRRPPKRANMRCWWTLYGKSSPAGPRKAGFWLFDYGAGRSGRRIPPPW